MLCFIRNRIHIQQFDGLCRAEVAFFCTRTIINVLAMWTVMRYFHLLRVGVTWRGPEAIELWYRHHASDSSKESQGKDTTMASATTGGGLTTFHVPGGGRLVRSSSRRSGYAAAPVETDFSDDDSSGGVGRARPPTDVQSANESGSDELDSLLVAYDSNSIASVWRGNARTEKKTMFIHSEEYVSIWLKIGAV